MVLHQWNQREIEEKKRERKTDPKSAVKSRNSIRKKNKSSLICERNCSEVCIHRHSKGIRRRWIGHTRVDKFWANYCGLSSICTNLFIWDYIGLVAATLGITITHTHESHTNTTEFGWCKSNAMCNWQPVPLFERFNSNDNFQWQRNTHVARFADSDMRSKFA